MGNWPFCLCHQPGPSCTVPALSSEGLTPALTAGTLGGFPGEARLSGAAVRIQGRAAQPLPGMFTQLGAAWEEQIHLSVPRHGEGESAPISRQTAPVKGRDALRGGDGGMGVRQRCGPSWGWDVALLLRYGRDLVLSRKRPRKSSVELRCAIVRAGWCKARGGTAATTLDLKR